MHSKRLLLAGFFALMSTSCWASPGKATVAQRGREFLAGLLDADLGILPEFRGAKVYWLSHDNYLAAKLLAKSHPKIAGTIMATMEHEGLRRTDGKTEMILGERKGVLPFREYALIDVRTIGAKIIRTEVQIGIMNSDGTNERILTKARRMNVRLNSGDTRTVLETAYDANAPAWSPVADKIAFWSGIETKYGQIWVMNPDGTESQQLTDDPNHRNSDDPSWSPDGKQILFSTGRSGRNELWVMDADGKNQRKLHDIDAFPFPGRASWQPVK